MNKPNIQISPNSKTPPCYKCKNRKLGCHDKCAKYEKWSEENEKLRKKFIEDNVFVGNESWGYTKSRKG